MSFPQRDQRRAGNGRRVRPLFAVCLAGIVVVGAAGAWWRSSRAQHCGTTTPTLVTTPTDECVGVTDGSAGPAVFGRELQPALTAIAAENREVEKGGPGTYVTVAFMAPMGSGAKDLTGGRTAHEVEGAFVAQRRANASTKYPKIRLVLANMGSDETHWRTAVDHLKPMVEAPDSLVAVTGMGLSQYESVEAARLLATVPAIPMVSDIITARGFNSTGTIDKDDRASWRGPIDGLVRVAPDVDDQIRVIGKRLKQRRELKEAVLVWSDKTPQDTPDLYTVSLGKAFQNPQLLLKPYLDRGRLKFPFNPEGKGDEAHSLETITNGLCGRHPDMIFYAARQTYLSTFLEKLHGRPCPLGPITVVTGSDAAAQPKDTPALHDAKIPISLMYVPLADPVYLNSENNPHHVHYREFAAEFSRNHHGQVFPLRHLDDGWGIMAHDAMLTAITAVNNAVAGGSRDVRSVPTPRAVRSQLYLFQGNNVIRGAGGSFRIDPVTGNRVSATEPEVVEITP
ncbi:hypothetical protein ACLQ2R_06165 [Streptosporangium sp. DT93]|uniref:hypothetical protein n=1 Tax=Streptosporangium sp. DT93 TaxID=3393428 RepID=UPI003CFADE82